MATPDTQAPVNPAQVLKDSQTKPADRPRLTPAEESTQVIIKAAIETGNPVAISISAIKMDLSVQVRKGISKDTVNKYAMEFDELPPVEIWQTTDTDELIMVDGFTRMAAAKVLGKTHIGAIIKTGKYIEAQDRAAQANTTHGQGLTVEELGNAISRVRANHGNKKPWTLRYYADFFHCGFMTVKNVFDMEDAKTNVQAQIGKLPDNLTDTHFRVLGTLKPEVQGQVAATAAKNGWTSSQTQLVVSEIKDPKTETARSAALLNGTVNPFEKSGSSSVTRPVSPAQALMAIVANIEECIKLDPKAVAADMGILPLRAHVLALSNFGSWMDRYLGEATPLIAADDAALAAEAAAAKPSKKGKAARPSADALEGTQEPATAPSGPVDGTENDSAPEEP